MQDILAIMIAFGAAGFLVWRMWQAAAKRRSGVCGACSNCPSNGAGKASSLVSISPVAVGAKSQRGEGSPN